MQANPNHGHGALAPPPRCDCCSEPATHIYGRQPVSALCETCARRNSDHTRGEAWASARILSGLLDTLRGAGCNDDEIRGLVDTLLQDEERVELTDDVAVEWQVGGFDDDHRFIPLTGEAS